ncbi:SPOR domain-containing protein [Rubrivirga sp. IMCC45206]|uniref:SPOR domain-containing protein n=1 Tax=Rubrivirga sp. IMCC45206 TaxID=3391614 RepID=UPI00398FF4E8
MRTALLVVLSLSFAACSAVGPAAPEAPPETGETPAPGYPAYETFDPTGYDAEPEPAAEVVHDVPAGIMAGRVVVPTEAGPPAPQDPQPRQVEGFRVQIFSGATRAAAERVRDDAVSWWTEQGGNPRELGAIVAYLQPYYRVRLGAFATREQAEAALATVRRQFPEAFLVPDLVTIND